MIKLILINCSFVINTYYLYYLCKYKKIKGNSGYFNVLCKIYLK